MRAHLSIACVRLTTEACEARASTRVREQSITAASIPIIVTKSTETYLRRRARDARLHGVRNTTMAFSSTEFHRCVFLCLSLYSVHTSSHARRENKTTPRRTDISIASARTQRDSYTHSVMVSCVYASRFTLRSYTHTHTHSLTHTAIIYTHSPTAGHALPCECCTADFRYQPFTYDTCMSTHVHTLRVHLLVLHHRWTRNSFLSCSLAPPTRQELAFFFFFFFSFHAHTCLQRNRS